MQSSWYVSRDVPYSLAMDARRAGTSGGSSLRNSTSPCLHSVITAPLKDKI